MVYSGYTEEVIPKYFKEFTETMNRRFDGVDEKLDLMAATLQRHEKTLDEYSILLRAMVGRHDSHEERISHLERSVTRLRLKIDN